MLDTHTICERLDYYLLTYGSKRSLLCASEMDGFFTSLVCNKEDLQLESWLSSIWGSEEDQPTLKKEEETEFVNLVLAMYINTLDSMKKGELHPLYMETNFNGETEVIIDEWCIGFMRGAHITGLTRTGDQDFLNEVLAPVRLFGTERGWKKMETMSAEEIAFWQDLIEPSILRLLVENNPDIRLAQYKPDQILH